MRQFLWGVLSCLVFVVAILFMLMGAWIVVHTSAPAAAVSCCLATGQPVQPMSASEAAALAQINAKLEELREREAGCAKHKADARRFCEGR